MFRHALIRHPQYRLAWARSQWPLLSQSGLPFLRLSSQTGFRPEYYSNVGPNNHGGMGVTIRMMNSRPAVEVENQHPGPKDDDIDGRGFKIRTGSRSPPDPHEERLKMLYGTPGPVLLQLTNLSRSLTVEDFKLFLPEGKHIPGWRSQGGLVKAIPGRDVNTLRRKDYWILLFNSGCKAAEYYEALHKMHVIAKGYMPGDSLDPKAPLPGMATDDDGRDIGKILKNYSVLAPSQLLRANVFVKGASVERYADVAVARFPDPFQKLLDMADEWENMTNNGRKVWPVRFSVEGCKHVDVTVQMVRYTLYRDKIWREVPWNFVWEAGISKTDETERDVEGAAQPQRRVASVQNFIIPFWEEMEAKRFVRYWDRRGISLETLPKQITGVVDTECLVLE